MASKQFRVSGKQLDYLKKLADNADVPAYKLIQTAITLGIVCLKQAESQVAERRVANE